jgi:hypothetical protein
MAKFRPSCHTVVWFRFLARKFATNFCRIFSRKSRVAFLALTPNQTEVIQFQFFGFTSKIGSSSANKEFPTETGLPDGLFSNQKSQFG